MPSTPKRKPLVIVTRKLPDAIETRLMELFDTRLNADDKPLSGAQLVEAVKAADVLVPTVTDRIDSRVLSQAGPKLKLIASFGTGVDHIDLDTARQRGITVTNTPGVLTEDTADMAMALVLATARRMGEGERLVRGGKWSGWSPTSMLGGRLQGKRMGIVGMGRIGQALARRARGFGLAIHYHNRKRVHAEIERELEAARRQKVERRRRMRAIDRHDVHARQHLVEALPVGRLELALDLAMDALAIVIVDGEAKAPRATRQRLADAAHALSLIHI